MSTTTSPATKTYNGTCACASQTWTAVLPDPVGHVLCHCGTCQQLGGAPYSCNQIIPEEDLEMTTRGKGKKGGMKGEEAGLKCYRYKGKSGGEVRCWFCGECGSHVYHEQDALPNKLIVRTLLLDGGRAFPVSGEIFPEGRLGFVAKL